MFVFVYLADILIFSRSRDEAEKCEFHVPSVSFLGYVIGRGTVLLDSAMVAATTTWTHANSFNLS